MDNHGKEQEQAGEYLAVKTVEDVTCKPRVSALSGRKWGAAEEF